MSIHKLSRATLVITGRVEQFFTSEGIYLRRSTTSDITLAALLRSGCETSRAIVALVCSGHGAVALGLSRSIIEIWITVRWLTNVDTDKRAEQFLHFNSKQRERILELINEYYPGVSLDRFKGNRHHDRRAMLYKAWDRWGVGIKKMAQESEHFAEEPSGAASPKWAYDIAFFISSSYFHPTSLGLHRHFLKPGDRFTAKQLIDANEAAEQGMIFAAQFLLQIASRIASYWGLESDDFLSDLWNRYLNPIGENGDLPTVS
jgi:hypothetical protein